MYGFKKTYKNQSLYKLLLNENILQSDFLMTYLTSLTTVHPKVYSRRPFPTDSTEGKCKGLRIRDVFFSFLGLRFRQFEAISLRRVFVWFKHVCSDFMKT